MNWRVFAPVFALVVVGLLWEALVWVNDWPNYKMASPRILDLPSGSSAGYSSSTDGTRCGEPWRGSYCPCSPAFFSA